MPWYEWWPHHRPVGSRKRVGYADLDAAIATGTPDAPRVTAPVPSVHLRAVTAHVDISLPGGNVRADVVIAAGRPHRVADAGAVSW